MMYWYALTIDERYSAPPELSSVTFHAMISVRCAMPAMPVPLSVSAAMTPAQCVPCDPARELSGMGSSSSVLKS